MEQTNEKQMKRTNKRKLNKNSDNSSDGQSKSQMPNSKPTATNSLKKIKFLVSFLPKTKQSQLSDPSTCNGNNSVSDDNKVNYSIGDIVWAKTGKYPVWPGMVIRDPDSNIYYKNKNNLSWLHIYYFNDSYRRNWVRLNQIFGFYGKDSIFRKFPKLNASLSQRKIRQNWNKAVDEAECMVTMDRDIRLNAYFSNNILTNSKLKKKAQDGSSNELSTNDQQPATVENQPSTSCVVQNGTEVFDSVFNQNVASETQLYNGSSNELSSNDQQPATIDNQPSISCVVQTKTDVSDGHFNQNVANNETQIPNSDIKSIKEHPMVLIPELCKLFYSKGWHTSIGGDISIKLGNCIYIVPSEVLNERIEPEDIFVQDINGVDIKVPSDDKNLRKSKCSPIFLCSYRMRDAGAVFFMNSLEVLKLCLLYPGKHVRIQDLEIIKGIYNEKKQKYYNIGEEVIVPIIENSKNESDLVSTFKRTLKKYPMTSAVLVRNHGMYVWGKDWQSAKSQYECYDFAFKVLIFKKLNGV